MNTDMGGKAARFQFEKLTFKFQNYQKRFADFNS